MRPARNQLSGRYGNQILFPALTNILIHAWVFVVFFSELAERELCFGVQWVFSLLARM